MSYKSTTDEISDLASSRKPDDLKEIPDIVIETLGLEEDEGKIPTRTKQRSLLTFRYFLLSFLFVIPGAFLDTMNSFRTTSAPYGVLIVQLLAYPLGAKLAQILPSKEINLGLFKFNLNPGPWTVEESVLVTLTAASGATGNQGTFGISLAKIFYNIDIPAWAALAFMYGIVGIGYSYGAIARNFVLYDPKFIWPKALMQTSLFRMQKKEAMNGKGLSPQMKIFLVGMTGMFLWQFLPEFAFPLMSSLAVLCWMAPYNKTLNFLGSGLGGLGFLNISLDWSNITSEVMLSPYWTIALQFIGFAVTCWAFLPFCRWFHAGKFATGLMDNHPLLSSGGKYPIDKLITPDMHFNETAFHHYGPIYYGSQRLFNIFFDYAAYTCALCWLVTFGWKDLKKSWNNLKQRRGKSTITLVSSRHNSNDEPDKIQFNAEETPLSPQVSNEEPYTDRINKRYSRFKDIPNSWFAILFGICFTILSIVTYNGYIFMPWRTLIVALIVGSIIVTPMAYLYATSNFQLAIGTFNELLYGIMIQSKFFIPSSGIKHPVGASMYGAIAGNCWYRAQYILQDQKIGLYNQVPPREVFFSQVFGDLIGIPFNYLALRWVLKSKMPYLRGEEEDPLHQWTGQNLVNYMATGVQYVLVGPKALFSRYKFLPYGFAVGIIIPICLFSLFKLTKRHFFQHFNPTIIFSTMSQFYGNISTGYLTKFLLGTYTMYYLQRYRKKTFEKYNYALAAAFDTGFNLCNLVLFIFMGSGKPVSFPHWWGNDATNVEKCYAL